MAQLTEPSGLLPESHRVPDILAQGMRIVFCGTALGASSARLKAYYANPGNYFWRSLHRTGITPHQFIPTDYAQVAAHGIGLTDLSKTAYGQDDALPPDAFDIDALRQKILHYQPAYLAFTSKAAASAFLRQPLRRFGYGLQRQQLGITQLFVLPSPSGRARSYWNEAVWQELSDRARTSSS